MKKIFWACSFCSVYIYKPLTLLYSQLYTQPVSKASISAKPGARWLSSLASLPLVNPLPWQWSARVGPWCSSKLFLSDCVASWQHPNQATKHQKMLAQGSSDLVLLFSFTLEHVCYLCRDYVIFTLFCNTDQKLSASWNDWVINWWLHLVYWIKRLRWEKNIDG